MSIRLRLTVLYSLILALTLIGVGAALYFTLARATISSVGNTLADEAQQLLDQKRILYPRIVVIPVGAIAAPKTFIQLRSADGDVTARTPNLGDFVLPLSSNGLQAMQTGSTWLATTPVEGRRLLIYSRPIKIGSNTVGIVQLAQSLADQDQSLNTLKWILIVASSLVTLIAFGVGWLLAGVALSPINRITQTAQEIEAKDDFDRRVEYRGPHDEIGRLATTFNAMLQALQGAYQRAETSLHAQRRFVADASHELRTPLTTIRGNAALLQRDPPISEDDRIAVVGDIASESERMINLVNELLTLARADTGRVLNSEPVLIQPLIDELYRTTTLLDPTRPFTYQGAPDIVVQGDRNAIKEILLILVDNALQHTPASAQITVSADTSGDEIAIHVTDTGTGIDPSHLPHIFDRFYRGDPSRTGKGTGLGLAIAKALVEAQHGRVTVQSQLGQGSTFTIYLPPAVALSDDVALQPIEVHQQEAVSR